MTAARDASQKGLKTLLLEARPRLGGQTFTTTFGGHDIDAGGTGLGWGQPHVWAECMRYQMPIVKSASTGAERFVWYSRTERFEGGYDEYGPLSEEAYSKFYQPAREMFPQPYNPLYSAGSKKFQTLDAISAADAIDRLALSDVRKEIVKSLASINGHSPSKNTAIWTSCAGLHWGASARTLCGRTWGTNA